MTITECGGFLRMGGCTKMQSDEAHIKIKDAIAMAHPRRASFGSLPFASLSATSLA